MKITSKTKISELMEIPGTEEIFFESGIGCFGCSLSHFETIGQGMKGHGFSDKEIKEMIKGLNKLKELNEKKRKKK